MGFCPFCFLAVIPFLQGCWGIDAIRLGDKKRCGLFLNTDSVGGNKVDYEVYSVFDSWEHFEPLAPMEILWHPSTGATA